MVQVIRDKDMMDNTSGVCGLEAGEANFRVWTLRVYGVAAWVAGVELVWVSVLGLAALGPLSAD